MAAEKFAVIVPRMVGNVEDWTTAFSWDGSFRPTRKAAYEHGVDTYGHDDFYLGRVMHGVLLAVGHFDGDYPDDHEDLADVARQVGLEADQ